MLLLFTDSDICFYNLGFQKTMSTVQDSTIFIQFLQKNISRMMLENWIA